MTVKEFSLSVVSLPTEHGNIESSFEYLLTTIRDRATGDYHSKNILDIGCRHGTLIRNLQIHGFANLSGIDINEKAIRVGLKAYPSLEGRLTSYDGQKLPFEDETFHVISMFDVLEHVPCVSGLLDEIYRVLQPSGVLVGSTPNKPVNVIWESINTRSMCGWKRYHCSLQTRKSLYCNFNKSNFVEIQFDKFRVDTGYNRRKVRNKIGCIGVAMLRISYYLPMSLYPNIFFSCKK